MKTIRIGLIGTGFMGKTHALAYRAVKAVFGDVPTPQLEYLCDTPGEAANKFASQFGFARATDDWRALVNDPGVDLVCITTPNKLHPEMAIAALAAGKHVHCEKPMALTLSEAHSMKSMANSKNLKTIVGYNYLHNPTFIHAQKLVREGAIGRIVHFRGFFDEDYQADPETEWSWRAVKSEAGLGTLGDLGCHLISFAISLVGPIKSLVADTQTVHATRPTGDGDGRKNVENEDIASALLRFENGVSGVISSSRSAWGRKSYLAFEIHGDKGMLRFDQERLNELQLYRNNGPKSEQGFTTILAGPDHPPYANFCPAPGVQLGFVDLKTIEVHTLLRAIQSGEQAYPCFTDAYEIEKTIHAIARSGQNRTPVELSDM